MIEYMLLFVGLVIIGIQGYLIAKVQQMSRNPKWEKDTTEAVIDVIGRVRRLEERVFPDEGKLPTEEVVPEMPPDKTPSWMDKWNI